MRLLDRFLLTVHLYEYKKATTRAAANKGEEPNPIPSYEPTMLARTLCEPRRWGL
jgi:hypothetical protein